MQPLGGRVRRRVRRAVLRLETLAADDAPLLCECEDADGYTSCWA